MELPLSKWPEPPGFGVRILILETFPGSSQLLRLQALDVGTCTADYMHVHVCVVEGWGAYVETEDISTQLYLCTLFP